MNELQIPFEIGDSATFTKTISECDVYLFAGITGDMNQVHLDEAYASTTDLKHRIAHGCLTFSIGASAETVLLNEKKKELNSCGLTYLSYGYDKLRFLKPVYFGDTVTGKYELVDINNETMKTVAHLTMTNQHGETVCVCDHLWKFFPKKK